MRPRSCARRAKDLILLQPRGCKEIPPGTSGGQPADSPGNELEFISKSKEGCTFQTGDYVKIVGAEAGEAQTIHKLARDTPDSQ